MHEPAAIRRPARRLVRLPLSRKESSSCPDFSFDAASTAVADDFAGAVMPSMKRKVPVNVDLVFVVDRTGSSAAFAKGIRRAIPMIARTVLDKAARVRLFLQTHGDLDYGQRPIMVVRDGNFDELTREVERVVFEGGGDAPEHHTHALETLLDNVDWGGARPYSRAVVLFTTADTKPSPSGRSAAQVAEALLANDVKLFAVCEMESGMKALIERAQSQSFAISNDPSEAEMQGIGRAVGASVTASLVDTAQLS
jgi:hypothetical protein